MKCPECQGELNGAGHDYECTNCHKEWKVDFLCEECHNPPEELKSCGSVSFFCQSCKKLKSREAMEKRFTPL
ncbi:MAG: zinc-ribbon domain-containing protein [Spirochaetales bacterium]|nr:zinc-ribbon domain-containing protein [Spirochaetales bacterium]